LHSPRPVGCLEDEYKVTTVVSHRRDLRARLSRWDVKRKRFRTELSGPDGFHVAMPVDAAKKVDSTSKRAENVYTARKRFADFDALALEYLFSTTRQGSLSP